MMKRIKLLLLLLLSVALQMSASLYRPSDVPNVHVADRTKYVSNPDGILSQEAVTRIDSMLADVWRKTSAEVVVVVVGSVDGDIDDFATRLFTDWGVERRVWCPIYLPDELSGILPVRGSKLWIMTEGSWHR